MSNQPGSLRWRWGHIKAAITGRAPAVVIPKGVTMRTSGMIIVEPGATLRNEGTLGVELQL